MHEVMTGSYLLKARDALMLGALQLRVDLEENKKYIEKSLRYLLVEASSLLKLKNYLFYFEGNDTSVTKFDERDSCINRFLL